LLVTNLFQVLQLSTRLKTKSRTVRQVIFFPFNRYAGRTEGLWRMRRHGP